MRTVRVLSSFFILLSGCSFGDDASSSADDLTEADLANREFIHSKTYEKAGPGNFARQGVELEGITNFACTGGAPLLDVLRAQRNGRTTYQRLRNPSSMEAFSTTFPIDEIPWSEAAHAIREQSPFVWLSIEPSRFEVDSGSGRRELSVGTDIMDDTYYDTPDFILSTNAVSLRARARWDTPTEIRRILIGAKMSSAVASSGIKSAGKHDIRNDGASGEEIAGLDRDLRRGFVNWGQSDAPANPVRDVYEQLSKAGKFPSVTKADGTTFDSVMLLDPKAHLRSVRSRFHLNEAPINAVQRMHGFAETRLNTLVSDGSVPQALATKMRGYLDGSLVASRSSAALKGIDSAADTSASGIAAFLPKVQGGQLSDVDLEKRRVIAETVSAVLHEIGKDLEAARGQMSGADASLASHVDRFRDWVNSAPNADLGVSEVAGTKMLRTVDHLVTIHATLAKMDAGARARHLQAYNAFGAQAGGNFTALDDGGFVAIGKNIRDAQIAIWRRQIEAAGTAANGLWFDEARRHFVPDSRRNTQNFLIDTMDMTEMLTHSAWMSIPDKDRTADKTLPKDKIFHTVLVNELQIELMLEAPYVERIKALEGQPAGAERDRQLAGAKLVFGKYQEMLTKLSQLKAPEVVRRLEEGGGQGCSGKDAPASKGDQAIERVKKMGGNP